MKPIKANDLNEKLLIETIELMKANYDQMTDEIQRLSRKMKEENGLKAAVTLIQQVCHQLDSESAG
jgi:UDP:flavonoid glycosyltransferase YjiC (YdhE family)